MTLKAVSGDDSGKDLELTIGSDMTVDDFWSVRENREG